MARSDDAAASELVGNIMLIVVTVALVAVIAVTVSQALSAKTTPTASLSLSPIGAGDTSARIAFGNGESINLSALRITMSRNASTPVDVPRANWTTPNATTFRAGDRLSFAFTPAVGAGELIQVSVYRTDFNALLADIAARAPGSAAGLFTNVTLTGTVAPGSIPSDARTTAVLAARVSSPMGALGVASVVADLSNMSAAGGFANVSLTLNDLGQDGDAAGGDGNWSTYLTVATTVPAGSYRVWLNATDASGALLGTTNFTYNVTTAVINATSSGGGFGFNSTSDFLNATGLAQSNASTAGTRARVPTSTNVTQFHLTNFSWDRLHPSLVDNDALVMRIIGNGAAWSLYMQFGYTVCPAGKAPCVTHLQVWNNQNETWYDPAGGASGVNLSGLDINLLNILQSGQWSVTTGTGRQADPSALYQNSAVLVSPELIMPFYQDERVTGGQSTAANIGLYTVDVIIS